MTSQRHRWMWQAAKNVYNQFDNVLIIPDLGILKSEKNEHSITYTVFSSWLCLESSDTRWLWCVNSPLSQRSSEVSTQPLTDEKICRVCSSRVGEVTLFRKLYNCETKWVSFHNRIWNQIFFYWIATISHFFKFNLYDWSKCCFL